jgi:UPF0755 protein
MLHISRVIILAFFVCAIFLHTFVFRAPAAFPTETLIAIEKGEILAQTAKIFAERGLVRSAFWLRVLVTLRRGNAGAVAGNYFFRERATLPRIAERLATGEYGLEPKRIVIPEGLSNREVAVVLARAFPSFSTSEFLSLAKEKEGFLFPDTYNFFPNADARQVIIDMENNFKKKTSVLKPLLVRSGKPLREIVIMASLVEKEARTLETRQKIAGILWKRLRLGMLLQVDAVFPYIFAGKRFDLRNGDLQVDSPYNTYRYKGLPPTAIANPGLESLRAALTPLETPYLYYLSDREGNMHYARTHDEHLTNRATYLNL